MNSGISEIRLSHTKNTDINVLWTLKGIHPGCNTLDKGRWWAIGGTGLLHHLDKYCFMPLSAADRSCLLLSSVSWSHHHACFAAFQVTVHQCKLQRKQSLFWAETSSLDSRNTNVHRRNLCHPPCHPPNSDLLFLLYNAYSSTVSSHDN